VLIRLGSFIMFDSLRYIFRRVLSLM